MQDVLNFTFQQGYFDIGNNVDVPEGVIIAPSSNVIYDKNGRLLSIKQSTTSTYAFGGTRAFLLDKNLVGFIGTHAVTGIGNMLQGVGKSLWFVGNSSTARVMSISDLGVASLLPVGGRREELTVSLSSSPVGSGNLSVTFTGLDVNSGAPKVVLVALAGTETTASLVATKIVGALNSNQEISNNYTVYNEAAKIIVIDEEIRTNDFSVSIAAGLNVNSATSASVSVTEFTTSTTPQFCKWDTSTSQWHSPVSVGLPEIDDTPDLQLTTVATRSADFDGLIVGSRSVRVARKRWGAVSIASPSSNVVTGSESGDSLVVTIPVPDADTSPASSNSWLLYFTYSGLGSTATHKAFPLEIPEVELNGMVAPTTKTEGNAKYKVLKQSATSQADRQVEIEFNDNELVLVEPFEDYYPAESSKFIAKLGNVMCLIGCGDDLTGFDVSYPNSHEAYSPDWRDWFAEQPIALAQEQDMGFFWVSTANNTYLASWTGVTEGSAPVVMEKRSSVYGAIGEGATVCVNGLLYALTRGKTPVIISPDGQVNDKFGAMVKNSFSNFNETTEVGWDEETNSVIFSCGTTALAFQIDNSRWSAPITLVGGESAKAVFSLNGSMYYCRSVSTNLESFKWNSGSAAVGWNVTTAFQFGQNGRALKDIIQVEGVFSSPVNNGTITFKAYKNYSTSGSGNDLTSETLSASGSQITVRKYAESLDYDSIAARIDGDKGGQTVHLALYTVDVHNIQRLS